MRYPARPRAAALAAILLAGTLAACAGNDEPAYVERPPEELYLDAHDAIERGRYNAAADLFDEVERQHPYSQWATRAQLMAAYAHFQELQYDDAVIALDRFIQLHPGHQDIDYAYYLTALCYYERISDVKRDQEMTLLALDSLDEVIRRFPDSEFARDAQLKRDLTLDQLAGKEMSIGRWYLTRGHYNAAINRFRSVVENYQTTTHVPEALHRLTESYLALGLAEEAKQNAAVLGHNYPGSDWYEDSYALLAEDGSNQEPLSFFSRAWNSVF